MSQTSRTSTQNSLIRSKFPGIHFPFYSTKIISIQRSDFSSLLSSGLAKVSSLHPGECYAVSGVSRTDSLGLLLSGRCSVLTEAAFLHNIEAGQFLDSPEFESGSGSDSTLFKVTICAAVPSKMIVWQRKELEYLFVKKPKLGIVVGALISRYEFQDACV